MRRSQPASVDADILAPALRDSIDRQGQFRLHREADGELTEMAAKDLAAVFIQRFLPSDLWVEDRGAPIDFRSLVVCERAYYAASPLEPPAPDVEPRMRMLFSSRWLVGACASDGTQVGIISVASQAAHLILEDGHITGDLSNIFVTSGIPLGITRLPMAPEEAASTVARSTGERISALPELVLNPLLAAPQLAKWRIGIERPVGVTPEGGDAPVTVSSLHYGFGPTWRSKVLVIDANAASDSRQFKYYLQNGELREVTLNFRPG